MCFPSHNASHNASPGVSGWASFSAWDQISSRSTLFLFPGTVWAESLRPACRNFSQHGEGDWERRAGFHCRIARDPLSTRAFKGMGPSIWQMTEKSVRGEGGGRTGGEMEVGEQCQRDTKGLDQGCQTRTALANKALLQHGS